MNIRQYICNSLEDLGLTGGEANVYFAILQSNTAATADEIKERTHLSTSGTYKIIRALTEKGFIIPKRTQGSNVYTAVSLDHVSRKLISQSRKFLRTSQKLSEFAKLSNISADRDIVEGNELTDYYLNIPCKIDDFIWCVGSFEAVMNFFGPEIEREFIRTRIKKGRHADAVIFDDSLFSKELAGRDTGEKRETRLIPHSHYPLEFSYLFGNTCLDFYKGTDGEVKVLKSESPDLARARLIQYQTLWHSTEE